MQRSVVGMWSYISLTVLGSAVPPAAVTARAGAGAPGSEAPHRPGVRDRAAGSRQTLVRHLEKKTGTFHRTRKQKRCFPPLLNFGK